MGTATLPRADLAASVLPAPLLQSLRHICAQGVSDVMLVGGTALAGFYAAHRRSDDLDLFSKSDPAQQGLILAVRSLEEQGVVFEEQYRSAQYYRAVCRAQGLRFTIDAVLDRRLFEVGEYTLADGIPVATVKTLMMTKAATLLSRCSEKDLFDLIWILQHQDISLPDFLELGKLVDGGMDAEAVLMVVSGTELSIDACRFALAPDVTAADIHAQISAFKLEIQKALSSYLHQQPVPPMGKLVEKLRVWGQNGV